ncbi:MAG: HIT domain-containing protein [Panacagrimonas sp.]
MPFHLHPQLEKDCFVLGTLELCQLLLMNDQNYPWCILVPQVAGAREVHDLSENDQQQLLRESSRLGRAMMQVFAGHKLNVAALGNQVPQLHIHHIVRYDSDPAWPKPVWGHTAAVAYAQAQRQARSQRLIAKLGIAAPDA